VKEEHNAIMVYTIRRNIVHLCTVNEYASLNRRRIMKLQSISCVLWSGKTL